MMRIRGLGVLAVALLVSGCVSSGTIHVDSAAPLPADPLGSMTSAGPADFTTTIVELGNAPRQQQSAIVAGDRMQLHGVCLGSGSMVLFASAPGGDSFTETVRCQGKWSLTLGFPVEGLPHSPADRYGVAALLCGHVTKWAADVLGDGVVATDQGPTATVTPPSCPEV